MSILKIYPQIYEHFPPSSINIFVGEDFLKMVKVMEMRKKEGKKIKIVIYLCTYKGV